MIYSKLCSDRHAIINLLVFTIIKTTTRRDDDDACVFDMISAFIYNICTSYPVPAYLSNIRNFT